MSRITLSYKAAKLMKLCDLEGYKRIHDLLKASDKDSLCPAICMTEGCDFTTEMERDQDAGCRSIHRTQTAGLSALFFSAHALVTETRKWGRLRVDQPTITG
jgi:hypothetical protein